MNEPVLQPMAKMNMMNDRRHMMSSALRLGRDGDFHPDIDFRPNKALLQCNLFGEKPIDCGEFEITCPQDRQYILRMMIRQPFGQLMLPGELDWLGPFVKFCQADSGNEDYFIYVTVRSGTVTSTTDDLWHVDGFSMRIPHPPEHNYIWTDRAPTEFLIQPIQMPRSFNPLRHDIQKYFQRIAKDENVVQGKAGHIYRLTPYVIHRRPACGEGKRTFIRVSYVPIEIRDNSCSRNPLIPTAEYPTQTFRQRLIPYVPWYCKLRECLKL